jgi:hypothetical protein
MVTSSLPFSPVNQVDITGFSFPLPAEAILPESIKVLLPFLISVKENSNNG